jgi:hypothetical protein
MAHINPQPVLALNFHSDDFQCGRFTGLKARIEWHLRHGDPGDEDDDAVVLPLLPVLVYPLPGVPQQQVRAPFVEGNHRIAALLLMQPVPLQPVPVAVRVTRSTSKRNKRRLDRV